MAVMQNLSVSKHHALSVSELNRQVKNLLEASFIEIRVSGEISNFARPSSGHWYFTLKDHKAQVRCAMFRNANQRVGFTPKEGDQVVLSANVSLYEGRGDFQLIGRMLEKDGVGQLQQAFERLKAQLSQEGLFDAHHKQAIPTLPAHLGVITSPSGAAIHDILSVLKRRYPGLPVTIYPAAVQGEDAPAQLRRALRQAQQHAVADLLIIGRGGGSLEDLWAFNDEALARDIFNCQLPIISAVGHEVDFSISDWVADVRAPTPSAAAELISPDQDALRMQLDRHEMALKRLLRQQLQQQRERILQLKRRLRHPGERLREQRRHLTSLESRLKRSMEHRLLAARSRVDRTQGRLITPKARLTMAQAQLTALDQRLQRGMRAKQEQHHYQLANLAARLNSISPLATLERGYAIVKNAQGEVVTDAAQLHSGDQISATLNRGTVTARVESVEN
ncbi:exodeoxyribonuclease VII large subunit [Neptunomonas marina]|uniref:Exodeoxyribonuclease 7 large subunit n=2 Tax=Neptunomonas marina TaxID=1815562 RepID=A0A437Q790_9GAMM|nr:exodeoxyribonuclease VII large subunit [Neptunomonas marina]